MFNIILTRWDRLLTGNKFSSLFPIHYLQYTYSVRNYTWQRSLNGIQIKDS